VCVETEAYSLPINSSQIRRSKYISIVTKKKSRSFSFVPGFQVRDTSFKVNGVFFKWKNAINEIAYFEFTTIYLGHFTYSTPFIGLLREKGGIEDFIAVMHMFAQVGIDKYSSHLGQGTTLKNISIEIDFTCLDIYMLISFK
jgi:hypothetical protein